MKSRLSRGELIRFLPGPHCVSLVLQGYSQSPLSLLRGVCPFFKISLALKLFVLRIAIIRPVFNLEFKPSFFYN